MSECRCNEKIESLQKQIDDLFEFNIKRAMTEANNILRWKECKDRLQRLECPRFYESVDEMSGKCGPKKSNRKDR